MNKSIPMILAIVMVSGMTPIVMAEEYDLSDHPVYNWVWTEDINWSNETFSKPAVSNQHHLDILNVDYDPTHIYYEKATSTFDYCDLPQFSNYPKCR